MEPELPVVVIGAGLAGLCAARSLARLGIPRVVLEASATAGGRALSSTAFYANGAPLELGAELLHGTSTSLTRLAAEKGWALRRVFTWAQGDGGPSEAPAPDGGVGLYYDGASKTLMPFDDAALTGLHEELEAVSETPPAELGAAEAAGGAAAFGGSLRARLVAAGASELQLAMADAGYANTAALSSTAEVSVLHMVRAEHGWLEDMRLGDADYRLDGGGGVCFGSVVAALAEGVDVRCGSAVEAVEHREGGVTVRLAGDGSGGPGAVIRGRAAVVTASVAVLQRGLIRFEPPLPPPKLAALRSMVMEPAVKLTLKFSSAVWQQDPGMPLCHGVICSGGVGREGGGMFPEIWFGNSRGGVGARYLLAKDGQAFHVLEPATEKKEKEEKTEQNEEEHDDDEEENVEHSATVYCMADSARQLVAMGKEAAVAVALAQLSEVFSVALPEVQRAYAAAGSEALLVDWGAAPHVLGGYCGQHVGETPDAREQYAAPVGDALFFAGEACAPRCAPSVMTAHGAMDSGARAAAQVARALGVGVGAGGDDEEGGGGDERAFPWAL